MSQKESEFFSDFIRALKHDLQTPLTVLRAYFATSTPEHELLQAAKTSAERLTKITADLGKFSTDLEQNHNSPLDLEFLKESLESIADIEFVTIENTSQTTLPRNIPWGTYHTVALLIVGAWPMGQEHKIKVTVDKESSALRIEGQAPANAIKMISRLWRIDQKDPGYGFWVARLLAEKTGLRLTSQLLGDTLQVTLALKCDG